MKNVCLNLLKLILILTPSFSISAQMISIDSKILRGDLVTFKAFTKPTPFGSYLQMNLPFEPMLEITKNIEKFENIKLKSRGEAHITVITPVEYFDILKSKISMIEINQIALELNIQKSLFELVCVGKGEIPTSEVMLKTYFIVISSNDLMEIRRRIKDVFVLRGGNPNLFSPEKYYPHITIGFTSRDLHESDDVIKDVKSCVYPINLR